MHNIRELSIDKKNNPEKPIRCILTKGEQALLMSPLPFGSFTRLKLSVNQRSPTTSDS